MKQHEVRLTVEIKAPVERVWDALTRPEIVKQYFFGTEVDTDWKPGSPIFFRGSWEGKPYEDKGKILEITPEKRISYTYWSSFSGKPDLPENYKTISYHLEGSAHLTMLTVTQDNNANEDEKKHSEKNWQMVFDGLKKLLERIG